MSIDIKSLAIGFAKGRNSGKESILTELTVTENGVYDNPVIAGGLEPITWDGTIGDRPMLEYEPGVGRVKVSDTVPSLNDLAWATFNFSNGESFSPNGDTSEFKDYGGAITVNGDAVWFVSDANMAAQQGLPGTGTYMFYVPEMTGYVASITFPGDPPTPADGWNKVTVNVAGGGDNTVVDVESLPTENVDETKIYRVTETVNAGSYVDIYVSEAGTPAPMTIKEYAVEKSGFPPEGEFVFHVVESSADLNVYDMIPFGEDGYNFHVYIVKDSGLSYFRQVHDARDFMSTTMGFDPSANIGIFFSVDEAKASLNGNAYCCVISEVTRTITVYGIPDKENAKKAFEYTAEGEWVECSTTPIAELTVTENGVYDTQSIIWDGDHSKHDIGTERSHVFGEFGVLYKVSNVVLTKDDLIGAVVKFSDGLSATIEISYLEPTPIGRNDDIPALMAWVPVEGGDTPGFAVVSGVSEDDDGVYFAVSNWDGVYTTSLILPQAIVAGWNKVTVNVAGDIIDVPELPTENIEEGKIYRITNGDIVNYGIPNAHPVKRLVDGAWVELT